MDIGRLGYTGSMVLATLVAGWLFRRNRRHMNLTGGQRLGIALGGLIGAVFAAKLPFLFAADSSSGIAGVWLSDGKTVLWGLAGGYLGVEIAKWSLYVRTRTGDSFVVPVAVAIAIGRLGCLANGCCYGIATNQRWGWASRMSIDPQLLRHPAPLYESVFHLTFAAIAAAGIRRGLWPQRWMLFYLVSYSIFRFVSEYWRTEPEWLAGLTFYQCSAVLIGTLFLLILVRRQMATSPGVDPINSTGQADGGVIN